MRTTLTLSLALAPAALAQETPPQKVPPRSDVEVEVTTATAEVEARLLAEHEAADEAGDGEALARALAAMSGHDNEAFLPLAVDGLRYRCTTEDRRAVRDLAKELGTTGRKEVEALENEREAAVQAAAAHVLGNFPEDRNALSALRKAFRDKGLRKDKPLALAAVISSFGRLKHDRVEDDVFRELAGTNSKEVARAAVRYLGQLPTRDYGHVRRLCEMLDPPEPVAVDDPNNPGAGFWKAMWDRWSWTRREVTWALQQITGQVFRPAEGDHPSDAAKALAYVEEHRDELGLK